MQDLEQAIRERAYQLWIQSGCGHGNADAHWIAAQQEVLTVSLSSIARVRATGKKQRAPRGKSVSSKKKSAA